MLEVTVQYVPVYCILQCQNGAIPARPGYLPRFRKIRKAVVANRIATRRRLTDFLYFFFKAVFLKWGYVYPWGYAEVLQGVLERK